MGKNKKNFPKLHLQNSCCKMSLWAHTNQDTIRAQRIVLDAIISLPAVYDGVWGNQSSTEPSFGVLDSAKKS